MENDGPYLINKIQLNAFERTNSVQLVSLCGEVNDHILLNVRLLFSYHIHVVIYCGLYCRF